MRTFSLFLLSLSFLFGLTAQTPGHTGTGLASYFDDAFHGDRTKYGEIYNRNELTGAHKMYPHNSRVRVTNLENNRSVVVRIIDQGPFITGRIIEVSHKAAETLGMLGRNTTRVRIELLSVPGQEAPVTTASTAAEEREDLPVETRRADEAPRRQIAPPPAPTTATPQPRATPPSPAPAERVVTRPTPAEPDRTAAPRPTTAPSREPVRFVPENANDPITSGRFGPGLYKVELREVGPGTHGVQVASLANLENALQEIAKLQAKWFDNILVRRYDNDGGTVYKVILGPFDDQASATRYAKDLKKRYKMDGFTVELN